MFIYGDGGIDEKMTIYPKYVGILGIVFSILGIIFTVWGFITAPKGGIFFMIGLLWCIGGYIEVKRHFAKYSFCKDGIWVKYPLTAEKLIYWKDFHQVCICYMQFTNGKFVVIAFVRDWVKRITGTFVEGYHPANVQGVILFDYSKELYKKINVYCPIEIDNLTEIDFNKNT